MKLLGAPYKYVNVVKDIFHMMSQGKANDIASNKPTKETTFRFVWVKNITRHIGCRQFAFGLWPNKDIFHTSALNV